MYRLLLAVLFLFAMGALRAQDVHFSQFYLSPQTLNPALTGMIPGDTRVVANYRSQWESVTVPFQTMSLAADFSVLTGKIGDNRLGLGLLILNDKAGDSELSSTKIQLSAAFSKSLNSDGTHFIGFGAQYGLVQRSINYSKLYFDNQYDGGDFNSTISNGERFGESRYWYQDFNAGFSWSYTPSKRKSYYAGISMSHLNEAEVGLIFAESSKLYKKITGYFGMEIPLNGYLSIIPRGVYLNQGPSQTLSIGALLKYAYASYSSDTPTSFYIGTMTRLDDAQLFIARIDYGSIGISIAYDINVSKLFKASYGRGAAEIGIVYTSSLLSDQFYRDAPVGCPIF